MLATDMITKLQELIERHKAVEEYMGPLDIHVDTFMTDPFGEGQSFLYRGVSPDITFEYTKDGVYCVITQAAPWTKLDREDAKHQ